MTDDVPSAHPRSESLQVRHRIIDGMHKKIVAEAGLIAHGRGEAYDYLLGEKTHPFAIKAIKAAAAHLFLANHPVLSVNGNVTVLCPKEMVEFANQSKIPLEINLFYRKPGRIEAIKNHLSPFHPHQLLGTDDAFSEEIDEISSQRRIVDSRGIGKADVVFVPLEDGDRTEGLVKNNRTVITVDLNPLSRTSRKAHVSIVDNIIRVFPLLLREYQEMDTEKAEKFLQEYDNIEILKESLQAMQLSWKDQL